MTYYLIFNKIATDYVEGCWLWSQFSRSCEISWFQKAHHPNVEKLIHNRVLDTDKLLHKQEGAMISDYKYQIFCEEPSSFCFCKSTSCLQYCAWPTITAKHVCVMSICKTVVNLLRGAILCAWIAFHTCRRSRSMCGNCDIFSDWTGATWHVKTQVGRLLLIAEKIVPQGIKMAVMLQTKIVGCNK